MVDILKVALVLSVNDLLVHLIFIRWGFEISIIILVLVILWKLLSCLGEVDLAATSASTIADDVTGIDLLHVVIIRFINWMC